MGEFSELKIDELRDYASRWANQYRAIKRIVLYEYPVSPVEKASDVRVPFRYAIFFDVSGAHEEDIVKLEDAIGTGQTMDYDSSVRGFVGTRFDSVYQVSPPDRFCNHWSFDVKRPGEDLPKWFKKSNLPMAVLFPAADIPTPINATKATTGTRPNQKHKAKCREVAERLWKKYPKMTVPELHRRGEIKQACEGEAYKEKTFRDWVKDLNPDRTPGRRRKP